MSKLIRKVVAGVVVLGLIIGYFTFPKQYKAFKNSLITFASDFISAVKSPSGFSFPSFEKDLEQTAKAIEELGKPVGQKLGEIAGATSDYLSRKADEIVEETDDGPAEDENEEDDDEESELVKASVVRVVDGDTLRVIVDDEELKVRLLSVNAEESVHADAARNNEYGIAASDWLKEYMKGVDYVWLEYDQEEQDQYGRELCYVWLKEGVNTQDEKDIERYMVNAILLKEGYVYVTIYKPNNKNEGIFRSLQATARENKAGLWQYQEFADIADSR